MHLANQFRNEFLYNDYKEMRKNAFKEINRGAGVKNL